MSCANIGVAPSLDWNPVWSRYCTGAASLKTSATSCAGSSQHAVRCFCSGLLTCGQRRTWHGISAVAAQRPGRVDVFLLWTMIGLAPATARCTAVIELVARAAQVFKAMHHSDQESFQPVGAASQARRGVPVVGVPRSRVPNDCGCDLTDHVKRIVPWRPHLAADASDML